MAPEPRGEANIAAAIASTTAMARMELVHRGGLLLGGVAADLGPAHGPWTSAPYCLSLLLSVGASGKQPGSARRARGE